MLKLIVSDMDGTLLNHSSSIPQENIDAILWAKENGIKFAIATGRHLIEARALLEKANIKCPILSVNGSAILNEHYERVQTFPLDKIIAKRIIEIAQTFSDVLVVLTTVDNIVSDNMQLSDKLLKLFIREQVDESDPNYNDIIQDHMTFLQSNIVDSLTDYIDTLDDDVILKILISAPNHLDALQQIKKLIPHNTVSVSSSNYTNLEITSLQATKGRAITDLANTLNISLDDVMAIGDNMNDYSMVSIAGYGIAMGNAVDKLKEIATYVTDTNMNNGVAKAIYHYVPRKD